MQDGNRGWRRTIASPQPVRVIEAPIIERLAREGVLIIACGGGGIAVEELRQRRAARARGGDRQGPRLGAARDRDEGRPADDPDRRRRAWRSASASPASNGSTGSPSREAGALRRRRPLRRRQHGPEDRGICSASSRAAPAGAASSPTPRTSSARCAARPAPGSKAESSTMEKTLLAVNGTLMRGLELNPNLLAVGATFVREDETDACYRLWSIGDRHPAMLRTPRRGRARGARAVGRSDGGPRDDPAERAAGACDRQGGAEGRHHRARRAGRAVPVRRAARDHRIRRLARLYRGAADQSSYIRQGIRGKKHEC